MPGGAGEDFFCTFGNDANFAKFFAVEKKEFVVVVEGFVAEDEGVYGTGFHA